jgi:gluconolactonase
MKQPGLILALWMATIISMAAQTPGPSPSFGAGRVVKLDPALDTIVPATAVIEKMAGGFGFAEGPVWSRDGALLFSDIPGNAIHRLKGTDISVLRKPIFEGTDFKPGFHIGSNGLTLDREGRLIIAEHGNRRVTRLERNGQLTVLADKYEGKRLNSPNDLAIRSDGSMYFTDPPYGLPGQDKDPAKELPFSGVYRLADGKLQLLTNELTRPNGIAFSPDERYLYVANSDNAKRLWMRYEVRTDGTLGAGSVFYDLAAEPLRGIPDGLKVDTAGNLYGTGPGGVWIISPAGKALGRIEAPEVPANVAWGEDGKTLFLTARTSIYRVRLNASGRLP